jgi:predicted aconitase
MREEIKVDKKYMEAFNLGYELAKELNLKSPMFKDINSGNERMNAMQAGMRQHGREISLHINKGTTQGLDSDKQSSLDADSLKNKGNDNKGFDLSI